MSDRQPRRMSHAGFRLMSLFMGVQDLLSPRYIDSRVKAFGITRGMTVVDYGCGPGRYTIRFSRLVGANGKVYAVDIQELAVNSVRKKAEKYHLRNVEPVLAKGYHSGIPDHVADRVAAIDMFHSVPNPGAFLEELHRITKKDGLLIIDDGHQTRKATKEKIRLSGCWEVVEETSDHLKCRPL